MIVSQWYFSRVKLWLKKLHKGSINSILKNFGSFIKLVVCFGNSLIYIEPMLLISFIVNPVAKYIHKIQKGNVCNIILIYLLKPIFWFYEFFLKYKSVLSIISIIIFNDSASFGGYRLFYLKFRNWSRYEYFENFTSSMCQFNFIMSFIISTYFFYFLLEIFENTILLNYEQIQDLNYFQIYSPIFGLFISIFFCSPNNYISIALQTFLFCFVTDEEMFQGKLFN